MVECLIGNHSPQAGEFPSERASIFTASILQKMRFYKCVVQKSVKTKRKTQNRGSAF
jgi:hypothetical protein